MRTAEAVTRMSADRTDRWKAVRKGDVYCAPACGGGCTWANYLIAKKNAAILVRSLGRGWKPRVFENLGWHFEARHISGCLNVTRSRFGYSFVYHAYLGEGTPDHPSIGGRWVGKGKTAREAVNDAIRQARRELDSIKRMIAVIERNRV